MTCVSGSFHHTGVQYYCQPSLSLLLVVVPVVSLVVASNGTKVCDSLMFPPPEGHWWFLCLLLYVLSCSVMSDSLGPHGLQLARLLCPWNFPGKNTGVGCLFLLHGIFLTQGLNQPLLHWQAGSLPLSHLSFLNSR